MAEYKCPNCGYSDSDYLFDEFFDIICSDNENHHTTIDICVCPYCKVMWKI